MPDPLPFRPASAAGAPETCHPLDDKLHRALTVIELNVRNHPGVMSHITGLFARRAFNLEAILVVPLSPGETSRILLLVDDGPRLEQIERQLAKLHDVLALRHRTDLAPDVFEQLANTVA